MTNRQIDHEIKLSRQARQKLHKDLEEAKSKSYGSSTPFCRDFVRAYVVPFGESLLKYTSKKEVGKARVSALAGGYKKMADLFEYIEPDLVSYISLITIWDTTFTYKTDRPLLQEGYRKVGTRLENEMRNRYYEKLAPDEAFKKAIHKENHTVGSTPKYREKGARHTAEKLLVNQYGWDKSELFKNWSSLERLYVGAFVFEVAARFSIVTHEKVKDRSKFKTYFELTEPIKAQAIKYQTALENRVINKYPLLAIPKDWEQQTGASRLNTSGGYYQDWFKQDLKLCRDFLSDSKFGSDALNLLNTLSKTAWNLDSITYSVANHCQNKGLIVGKFNSIFEHPILVGDMPEHLKELNEKDPLRKDWVSKRKHAYKKRKESEVKSRNTRLAMNVARQYESSPRFYLSWSCDYRGRMYPQQSFLTEDSNDFERSLLTFSDGCKLDERGEEYAAQAVAEAYIGSKVSYADRSKWTRDNKDFIQAITETPQRTSAWETADKPWQFIQLASEWNRVVLQGTKPLWNVPIGADATSSGLQLLSAFRRDPVGMEYSNLFAPTDINDAPRDAYIRVLEIAREIIKKDPKNAWLVKYLNDRKLGKTILMKIIYGAKLKRNTEEVKAYFIDQKLFGTEGEYESIQYLTKVLRKASEQVFPMAFEALNWIKKLYSVASKKTPKPDSFSWTTPNLDYIHLKKAKQKTKRIESNSYGNISIPLDEIAEIRYAKMRDALAAGFVHSFDSCVLKSAFGDWNRPLVVVHDCFKVLPNDMDLAKERVRHGFVHVCSGDPLARLADDLGVSEKELPRLKQGEARLEDVLNSSYMFN